MDQYIEFISNHYLLCLGLVVVAYMLIQDFFESTFNKYESLSPLLAVAKMNDDSTVIIDVREPHEYIKGHIENSINIPLGKFPEKVNTLEKHKSDPIIVVCQSGSRTVPACKTLIKENFENVFNMIGGMQSWQDNNFPVKITSTEKF